LKNKSLDIHIQLYKNLQLNNNNKYTQLLKNELGIKNLNNSIFSTAEHIAPFNTINTVSFLLPQLLLQHFNKVEKKDVIILGGSLVSLDNIDYPRGFYEISNSKKAFNLFPQKARKNAVLLTDIVKFEDIKDKHNFFDKYDFLRKNFMKKYQNFAYQQSEIMEKIIKEWLFNSGKIIVKPLEQVAKNILIKLLENDDKSIKLLFKNIEIFKRDTYNVFCSWNETKGTFLFWEVTNKKLNKINFNDNIFKGKNISFGLDFKEILILLKNNKILPSVSLSLFIVSWLPNIPIAGGHKQYWYWQYMIESFDNIFQTKSKKKLSQFGYNKLNFQDLNILSKYGTGLELVINNIDKNKLFDEVFNLLIYKSNEKDGYYES